GTGVTQSDLVLTLVGNDLYIGLANGSGLPANQLPDVLCVRNWLDPLDRVETIEFSNGTTAKIADLLTAAGYTITAPAISTTIAGDANANTLSGSSGALLEGAAGNDTYTFSRG